LGISSIAAASVVLKQHQLKASAGMAIAKKSMDDQEAAAYQMIEALKAAAPPVPNKLDIKV